MARPTVYGDTHVSVSGGPRPQPAGIHRMEVGVSLDCDTSRRQTLAGWGAGNIEVRLPAIV